MKIFAGNQLDLVLISMVFSGCLPRWLISSSCSNQFRTSYLEIFITYVTYVIMFF